MAATDAAFAAADRVVSLETHYPRCHPSPLECCGCVADVNPATGQATIYMTSQAPHVIRTCSRSSPASRSRRSGSSPDIGGGFGNKVPVYPGYVVATAASLLLGRPVKWIEDRTGNLISTGFARLPHEGRAGPARGREDARPAREDALRPGLRLRRRAADEVEGSLFHIVTAHDIPTAHVVTDGAYTNKAPGGVAYRCSFRVTEASYLIERLVQTAAYELGRDPVEFRRQNFIKADQFPYHSATGFVYDSGDYERALDVALERLGYAELREEQRQAREEGRLLGIGVASFTEVVGAGPSKDYDILGIKMFDSTGGAAPASDRQGDSQARRQVAGPGPRDDVRADRRRGARDPARGHPRRGGRHRHHALRPRHLREPLDADCGRGHGPDRAHAPREGEEDRGPPARGVRGRSRLGR